MAQPTLSGLELNAGSGGSEILHDVVGGKIAQVVLVGYSTGDGLLNVVMTDAPLPVDIRADNVGGFEVIQDTAADLNCTEASAADIKASVQVMDDWDDGSDRCRVVGAAAEDAAAAGNPILVGGRYDSTERTLDNGDVGAPALSAAAETILIQQCKYVMWGAERCEVKRANVVTSTDGADVIPKVEAKKFLVLALAVTGTSATVTNIYFEDEDGTDLFGSATGFFPISVDADGDNFPGIQFGWNPGGYFVTPTVNKDLHVKLSAAQTIVINVLYIEIP